MGLKQTLVNLFTNSDSKPETRSMPTTPIDREALLQKFSDEARNLSYYEAYKADYSQLIEYLRDGQVAYPVIQFGFYGHALYAAYWAMLSANPQQWDAFDHRLLAFAVGQGANHYNYLYEDFYENWLAERVNTSLSAEAVHSLVQHLARHGVSEGDFWFAVLEYIRLVDSNSLLTRWMLARLDQYHSFSWPKLYGRQRLDYLQLLLKQKPEFVKTHLSDFLQLGSYNDRLGLDTDLVNELLAYDAAYYGSLVADVQRAVTDPGTYRSLQKLLAQYLPNQYESETLAAAYDYLELVRREMTATSPKNYFLSSERSDPKGSYELSAKILFDRILSQEEPTKAREYVYNWLKVCPAPDQQLFEFLSDRLGQDSVPFLIVGLQVDTRGLYFDEIRLAKAILKILAQYDYSDYHSHVWALTRHKSKQMREMAAVTLAKLGEAAIPEAEQLLRDKKADFRQTGALLLSLIRTDRAQALLMDALNTEKNDDTRDVMLESLDGLLPAPTTQAEVATVVEKARQRGKLDEPVATYLVESKLPSLYWQVSGEPLDQDTVRFLLYRQNRSKDIRPDLEARPLYTLIDRQRSSLFAHAVLKAYLDAGADPKGKGCLTVAAMLGNDDEIDLLISKVNQWADAGRGKMAEYAVQALALIGTNKALRAVEFYTRKYKNKNKNIGAAANEAFTIAADTLGISPYDLADSIIPDFGFTGLFRSFQVGDETYRAFIGADFKVAFLNEDNKFSKTLPKAAAADLKDEFKEISKEIRDIVKAQSGRLEQYLVIQRKWPADKWQRFFLGNPVMFAYAIRLIWGVFDDQQNLLFTFQCQEDQTLLNDKGDEIDLPDDTSIGMVHPLALTDEQRDYWSQQLADADIEPIFPQLTRSVVQLPELDRNLTIDRQFEGIEYGGYGFVSKMEKLGWFRGSVQDAGWIASYYKDFTDLGITAILTQQGNICVGYYDENAALGDIMFARAQSVQFGSYVYDEPSKDTDPRLIRFGEVPPIVYSEVMADMLFFKENDVRSKDNPL
ncbi:hypothetical protein GCM10028805_64850 [Spirosoma harenae]